MSFQSQVEEYRNCNILRQSAHAQELINELVSVTKQRDAEFNRLRDDLEDVFDMVHEEGLELGINLKIPSHYDLVCAVQEILIQNEYRTGAREQSCCNLCDGYTEDDEPFITDAYKIIKNIPPHEFDSIAVEIRNLVQLDRSISKLSNELHNIKRQLMISNEPRESRGLHSDATDGCVKSDCVETFDYLMRVGCPISESCY